MMLNITEMFGDHGHQASQPVVRNFMNCKMEPETLIKEHMILIISYLNEMEIMGAEVDGETQVHMIQETLPSTFENFKLNYPMNKLNYSLLEFMKELQATETLFVKGKRKSGEANFTESRPSTSSLKKKQRRGLRKAKKEKLRATKGKSTSRVDKSKDKCHHYGAAGHWKHNCLEYLKGLRSKGVQGNQKA